eukprot:14725197-Ditylum_brightwellii.AAC.1
MGVGGEEIQQFLSLIDLLHRKNFLKDALSRVEVDVSVALQDVTVSSMKRAVANEIKATLKRKHNTWKNISFFHPDNAVPEPLTYEKWLEISEKERPKVAVTVSFGMGWQRWGHCSISGHTFMIGTRTRKILASIVCAKQCNKCKRAGAGKWPEPHPCPQNYEGSSKAMEADAALELTVQMYREHNIYIDNIVANDDSTMKVIVRHLYDEKEKKKIFYPQWSWFLTNDGKKVSTALLPLYVPEPGWLVDPTHQIKVVGKRFFGILNHGKWYSNITKADCL